MTKLNFDSYFEVIQAQIDIALNTHSLIDYQQLNKVYVDEGLVEQDSQSDMDVAKSEDDGKQHFISYSS